MMRTRLLPSPAEVRRQHERELRDVVREIEGLQERLRGLGRDLSDDYAGQGATARETLGTATVALGLANWFLRKARRALP